ncbi:UV-B-induced protein At3g17800, chloroplastic [Malania oleifera]|uniref:UV-B-induced protein At3g17800, chloroplastic n=1 Tax=Malania oleifera TaxID=397392 RepID=UPI0025AE8F4D|nr:UV-B-induced protein At3g17800, chloroplastic [Malania oleifera]
MDHCLSYGTPFSLKPSLSSVNCRPRSPPSSSAPTKSFPCRRSDGAVVCAARINRRTPSIVASSAAGHCEYGSSLNTPHEPRSWAGRVLSGVLQNQRQFFHAAVAEQLEQLAVDRDSAVARMNLSSGSPESCLHRRIAELKEHECQNAIEDIMYMLIIYKFSDIRVSLVPRLSKCIYNGRLEIWPSKDWELESIYNIEVLEMIREHITAVVGLRAKASVSDNWATTQIQRLQLGRIYAASILYGYFLKSASLRLHLEMNLSFAHQGFPLVHWTSLPLRELLHHGFKYIVLGHIGNTQSMSLCQGSIMPGKKHENLKGYVMGFDSETLQRCAKLRSKEAENLIEKHSLALFGGQRMDLFETDEMISTSFSSLKRLVLEAVAFGSFLWDTEEYVDTIYKLKDN